MREAAFVLDFEVDLYLAPRKDDAHSLSPRILHNNLPNDSIFHHKVQTQIYDCSNLWWGDGNLKYKSSRVSSFHGIMVDGDEQSGVH